MDFKTLVPLLAQFALILVVASFGLKARAHDVFATMRDTRLIFRGVLAVNIIVPIAAITICLLLPIGAAVRIGVIIMAISPLAPALPAKMANGDFSTSKAVGLYVALILIAVVLVPLTVALLDAIFPADVSIAVGPLAKLVVISILLPICAGIAIGSWAPDVAGLIARLATIAGVTVLALMVALVLYTQALPILALIGNGSLFAIIVTVASGIVAGHLLGLPDRERSNALAMAASIRHPGIAAMIFRSNFNDSRTMSTIILFLLASLLLTAPYQWWVRRQRAGVDLAVEAA